MTFVINEVATAAAREKQAAGHEALRRLFSVNDTILRVATAPRPKRGQGRQTKGQKRHQKLLRRAVTRSACESANKSGLLVPGLNAPALRGQDIIGTDSGTPRVQSEESFRAEYFGITRREARMQIDEEARGKREMLEIL